MTVLRGALTTYPHTAALTGGAVQPDGYSLDFSGTLDNVVAIFRAMARELRWDLSEMGVTTALCAKEWDAPFTAIPVFVTRRFDHQSISYNKRVITEAKELEGKRIGMRSPNVPDVLWSLAVLRDTYGVDLGKVEWVITGDEHLARTETAHRGTLAPGQDLSAMLEAGELAAIMAPYSGGSPDIAPLVEDLRGAERRWYEERGYLPIHHAVVVRNELLDADPSLAGRLYEALVEAKKPFLERLRNGEDVLEEMANPEHVFGVAHTKDLPDPRDPVPYGVEDNARAIDDLLRYAFDQRLFSRAYDVDEVFALP